MRHILLLSGILRFQTKGFWITFQMKWFLKSDKNKLRCFEQVFCEIFLPGRGMSRGHPSAVASEPLSTGFSFLGGEELLEIDGSSGTHAEVVLLQHLPAPPCPSEGEGCDLRVEIRARREGNAIPRHALPNLAFPGCTFFIRNPHRFDASH